MPDISYNPPSPQLIADGRSTIYLVGCTKGKKQDAMAAKDIYMESPRFCHSRCIVESTGERWFILSAKHGLLSPERHIQPYDKAMRDLSESEQQQWAQGVIAALDQFLDGVNRVYFLTDEDYYKRLLDPLAERGITTETPLANLNEDKLKQWLKDRCEEIQSRGIAWK